MDMDSFVKQNLEEVVHAIAGGDVLVVGFPFFPERLLVDTRRRSADPPVIRVVGPVARLEERLDQLRKLRPRFGEPRRFVFFVWPKRLETLQQLGVWEHIVKRMVDPDHPAAAGECAQALRELTELERVALGRAVTGEGYQTLWQRPRT